MTRIALNGLGRIGKLLLRDLAANGPLESVVLVNDATGDAAMHAHLLEFDTVRGRFDADVGHEDGALLVAGHRLPLANERDPAVPPIAERGGDIVRRVADDR